MASFDEFLKKATAAGPERLIAGCATVAYRDGVTHYQCFGTESVDPSSALFEKPFSMETTMWIASCTKLMTAVSALQCVEKGILNLDDDISTVLSDWKERSILVGFDEATGEPLLEKSKGKLTLRMLLTHQSGLGYGFKSPDLERYDEYRKSKGLLESKAINDRYRYPLLFEPATDWEYGVGTDFAGKMVEKATGQTLQSYMLQHIWEPLGMASTTFRLNTRPDIKERRADMSWREDDGSIAPSTTRFFSDDEPDDSGGGGVFSSTTDYLKVLASLIKNDGILLTPASVDLLFEPCLAEAVVEKFQEARSAAHRDSDEDGQMAIPAPTKMNYALGGMLSQVDVPGGRKAGSMSWGGLPHLTWILDRTAGTALLFASQLLPAGDKITQRIVRRFEAAVYSGEFFALASQAQ